MSLPAIKPRKQRTINNGPVDLDNVLICRGSAYSNWTDIARDKLGQRELSLLQQRREMCDEIIILMIKNFSKHHAETFDICNENTYEIEQDTLRIYKEEIQNKVTNEDSRAMFQYLESVKSVLSNWKGCNTKKSIPTFREYFHCCRNWFDNRKMKLLAKHFWIPIMHLIKELTFASSIHTFEKRTTNLQNMYSNYLDEWILRGVFHGQIKPSNTRLVLLVPATLYSILADLEKNNLNLPLKHSTNDVRIRYLQLMDDTIETLSTSFEKELPKFIHNSNSESYTYVETEKNYFNDSLMFYQSPSCWESRDSDTDPFASIAPFDSW